jgi:hypothetical protein
MSLYEAKDLINKLSKLGDRLHLNREQAQASLDTDVLPKLTEGEAKQNTSLMMIDVLKLMFNSTRWEDRYGAINGSILLLKYFYSAEENEPTIKYFFWNTIRSEQISKLLIDGEFRVRN